MRLMLPVGLALVLQVASQPASAAPQPGPPRNGKHTVQAIFGGRDVIPLCVVAPREYVDGTAIAPGTNCTIVVYRSKDEGKPGTYTQEVGRGQGPIEREWIDVGAKVPPEGGDGGVIYLASCAVINGEWSDLNNQYMTIIWSPGQFEIKDYPAAGSNPGAPPGRRATVTGPEQYPSWLKEVGDAARGVGGGGDAYTVETLPLREYHEELDELVFTLTFHIDVAPDGTLSGKTDLEPLLATARGLPMVPKVEVRKNEVTGRMVGGSLNAKVAFAVTVDTEFMDQKHSTTIHADTDLTGNGRQGEAVRGAARTTFRYTSDLEPPAPSTKDWDFVAEPQGAGGMRLLAGGAIEGSQGTPATGFQTPASQFAGGGIVGAKWQNEVVGYISLSPGDSHVFGMPGTAPNAWLDPATGTWLRDLSFARVPGDSVDWYDGPQGVLESKPVGSGIRVMALRNGMGEVWGRTRWQAALPDGRTATGIFVRIWIVPVGGEALAQVKDEEGTGSVETKGNIANVRIRGNVVMRGPGREPVGGADISLVYLPTGGGILDPTWVTDSEGKFSITVGPNAVTGGLLPAGEYEVFVLKRSRDTSVLGPDEDLWPIRRYIINVTAETAKAGPIAVGTSIKMDKVKRIDFDLRERRPVRAGQE